MDDRNADEKPELALVSRNGADRGVSMTKTSEMVDGGQMAAQTTLLMTHARVIVNDYLPYPDLNASH
jgi:hypothetical protein